VKKMLERGNLARYRDQADSIRNRAVYEIPGILRRSVEGTPDGPALEPEPSLAERSLSEQRA
jgi:hypothetical protein